VPQGSARAEVFPLGPRFRGGARPGAWDGGAVPGGRGLGRRPGRGRRAAPRSRPVSACGPSTRLPDRAAPPIPRSRRTPQDTPRSERVSTRALTHPERLPRRLRRPRHAVRPTPRADTLAVRPRPETKSRVRVLDVDLVDLRRAFHDELEARGDVPAHERLDGPLGRGGVTDGDAEQRTARPVPGGFPERPRSPLPHSPASTRLAAV